MDQPALYATIVSALPILLVHLAGVVVTVILLVRRRSTPAILAVIGFGVLFMLDLANFGRGPLIGLLARQSGMRQFWIANTGIGCCCSIFDVAAVVCLIVALWQAVSGLSPEETTNELEEMPGGIVAASQEAPEDTAYATGVLEETLEGTAEVLGDVSEETADTSGEVAEESE